jgi:epoxyqueuosine reductase
MSLKDQIVAEAKRLGFNLVGVTRPDPPPHFDIYENWLRRGRHGEMGYLSNQTARQRRADPGLILPECRSIVVVGMPHSIPEPLALVPEEDESIDPPFHGRVASYAWGDDYHDLIPPRLKQLVSFIETGIGETVPNRYYTDTGPILERDLAQRAGLGWIGKNTCLINPAQGSYIFLAEMLLGIDLEPDPPFAADRCGTCTRCIDACPTACILPDRTIDAASCISYLTIELKNPIPAQLRPQMKNWIFGCDICQQVCPWNRRFATSLSDQVFVERPNVSSPDLMVELLLSPREFNRKFKGSPVKRAKRRGYLRNAAVALGNLKPPAAVSLLVNTLLYEPEPLVRGHAAWALGQIGGEAAWQALNKAEGREQDPYVLEEILSAAGGG